jgi:hypothetical protein
MEPIRLTKVNAVQMLPKTVKQWLPLTQSLFLVFLAREFASKGQDLVSLNKLEKDRFLMKQQIQSSVLILLSIHFVEATKIYLEIGLVS